MNIYNIIYSYCFLTSLTLWSRFLNRMEGMIRIVYYLFRRWSGFLKKRMEVMIMIVYYLFRRWSGFLKKRMERMIIIVNYIFRRWSGFLRRRMEVMMTAKKMILRKIWMQNKHQGMCYYFIIFFSSQFNALITILSKIWCGQRTLCLI